MVTTILLTLALVQPLHAAQNPLADRVEAVVIKGVDLPEGFTGSHMDKYRVFASYGSTLEPIPIQIEERDENGILLVRVSSIENKCDNRLDERDELVFMARDAGVAFSGDPPAGCSKTSTINITDKESGAVGYALLALCEDPPPLSTKDYVRFDAKTHTVISDLYELGWKTGEVYPYDWVTINNGPDILDRLKVRAVIGKWGINYTFHEDGFKHTFIGYTDGPVRVTWKADNYWSLGPLGKVPVPQYQRFYDQYTVFQNALDATMNPAVFGLDFFVMINHDLSLNGKPGYEVCANVIPECRPLSEDFDMDAINKLLDRHLDWGGVSGPDGAMMTRLVVDPRLTAEVNGVFVFDSTFEDPPEYLPGSMPKLGFNILEWKDVVPDTYDLNFYHFFMSKYSIEEVNRYDRLVGNPLTVSFK